MTAVLRRSALVVVLLASLAIPADAQSDELSFPPIDSTSWEGLVLVSGWIASDATNEDGSFTTTETDIINDTSISFELSVDDKGQVTGGTMHVNLVWFVESVGTAPTTLDPFHVSHYHHETGNLDLSGSANKLVASGSLEHESVTEAEGQKIDEVSGTETDEVEWVFSASEASCVRVAGQLTAATAGSIMNSVFVPLDVASESDHIHNELVATFIAYPATVEDPAAIKQYLDEVQQAADELSRRDLPEAIHLLAVIRPWQDLGAQLARLDQCQQASVGWQPEFTQSWLAKQIQNALHKALKEPDSYTASELIDLWDAGLEESALNSELIIQFLDAFHDKLNEAIADNDTSTIWDIYAFSSQYGYPLLHDQAQKALGVGG